EVIPETLLDLDPLRHQNCEFVGREQIRPEDIHVSRNSLGPESHVLRQRVPFNLRPDSGCGFADARITRLVTSTRCGTPINDLTLPVLEPGGMALAQHQ